MKKIIIIIYIIISLSYLSSNNCVHHSNLKNVYIKNSSALIISNEDLIKTIHPETIFTRLDVNSNNKFVHLEKQSFQFKGMLITIHSTLYYHTLTNKNYHYIFIINHYKIQRNIYY